VFHLIVRVVLKYWQDQTNFFGESKKWINFEKKRNTRKIKYLGKLFVGTAFWTHFGLEPSDKYS
jgi:hypothetical protein